MNVVRFSETRARAFLVCWKCESVARLTIVTPIPNTNGISEIKLFDAKTGKQLQGPKLPEDGFISNLQMTSDGSKLAFVHTTIPKVSRSGTELAEKTTQDALGNLAPADNPFLQNNVVDVFDFPNHDLRPSALICGESVLPS